MKGGRGNSNSNRGNGRDGRGGFGCGRGGGRGNNGSGGGRSGGNFLQGVFCQLCNKEGRTVVLCFKRFDTSFTGPPQKSASSANTSSFGVDTNWYVDLGATDQVTGDLEKGQFQ